MLQLNPQQLQAVESPLGNTLVLAGAGSGKTRVLVQRFVHLIQNAGASPYGILAVTFTNKAAQEMKQRIASSLQITTEGLWVGTFHGLAHRLLRLHYTQAGLPEHFQVIDSDDQLRVIKRLLRENNVDDKIFAPKKVQSFINNHKDKVIRAGFLAHQQNYQDQVYGQMYQVYEAYVLEHGLVDFAELLLRVYEMFENHPDLLGEYRERFMHILVDEFQDTNVLQYKWIKQLSGGGAHDVMAVGDDDQSIYGWRGAKVGNIKQFQREFAPCQVIRLEQNYRSTKNILAAANAVIAHNNARLGKNLWSEGDEGALIDLYAAYNEMDEARFLVSKIQSFVERGHSYDDVAILYRSNALSRVIEEALLQADVPYRIYGGLRFFERAEIKNALAYLRLVQMHSDDDAFLRVVNLPTRGIGDKTIEQLRFYAKDEGLSLFEAAQQLSETTLLPARARAALMGFCSFIQSLCQSMAQVSLPALVLEVIESSGLIAHYQKELTEQAKARVENLRELVTAAQQFAPDTDPEHTLGYLQQFLAYAVLESGDMQADAHQSSVQLMTMHAAKGLEFPLVMLAGMEQELFPSNWSQNAQEDRLEEERRLCYVAMTRAKEKLVLSYSECRRLYGDRKSHRPSRFIAEIPNKLLDNLRPGGFVSKAQFVSQSYQKVAQKQAPLARSVTSAMPWQLGQRVSHESFGCGVIVNCEGMGENARIQVHFDAAGIKWLMAAYAQLKPVQ